MNQARRAQYLKALGVTRWRDRRLVSKADKEATTPSEDSSVIEADWVELECGNYNTETGVCSGTNYE